MSIRASAALSVAALALTASAALYAQEQRPNQLPNVRGQRRNMQRPANPNQPGQNAPNANAQPSANDANRMVPRSRAANVPVELDADRKPSLVTNGSVLIKNATLLTVTHGVMKNADLLIQNGKIVSMGPHLAMPAGVATYDATGKFVTPGIVDAHSHIALDSVNEGTDSITCETNTRDVIDPQSLSLYRGLSNGVTSSLLLHGSANPIGGQSVVIKMKFHRPVEELPVPDAPRMVKFALGENVKRSGRSGQGPGRFPSTRMGVEAVYRRAFADARRYMAAWDAYNANKAASSTMVPPRRDVRLETLADILKGKIWVQCHSYRQDEMLMMLHLSKEYGFHLTLQHALEAYKITPEILAAGAQVSTFADEWSYKVEAFDAIPYNAALCTRAGIVTSVNSDNESGGYRLNLEAAKAIKFGGLTENEALRLITINPAMQLGIDKRAGSLDTGKDGDIAIWDGYPLSVYSKCVLTAVEGNVFYQRHDAFGMDKSSLASTGLQGSKGNKRGIEGNRGEDAPNTEHRIPNADATPGTLRVAPGYAIVGATVHPVSGPDIADGTVVILNNHITRVGHNIPYPRGVVVVNGRGLHVYPGLIDTGSQLGLSEIGQVAATQDGSEGGEMQPDLLAVDAVNPESVHFAIARNEGITTALTRPSGALLSGQSGVISNGGWTTDLMAIKRKAALHVAFPEGTRGLGEFRDFLPPDALASLRSQETTQQQALRDIFSRAKRYIATRAHSSSTPVDPQLEALVPYVKGELPVVFSVDSARGIRNAVAFAEEFKLKPIIAGGGEAWRLADTLAQKKIPVLYGLPISNSITSAAPRNDFDPVDTVWTAPAVLYKAGVPLAFQSESATMSKNLPTQAGITCAYGMPHEAVVKALTLGAAQILGVADSVGSLESGKLANVIVTDGDPLEITTHTRYVFLAGKPMPLVSKHTLLYDKYRQRLDDIAPTDARKIARRATTNTAQ